MPRRAADLLVRLARGRFRVKGNVDRDTAAGTIERRQLVLRRHITTLRALLQQRHRDSVFTTPDGRVDVRIAARCFARHLRVAVGAGRHRIAGEHKRAEDCSQ